MCGAIKVFFTLESCDYLNVISKVCACVCFCVPLSSPHGAISLMISPSKCLEVSVARALQKGNVSVTEKLPSGSLKHNEVKHVCI